MILVDAKMKELVKMEEDMVAKFKGNETKAKKIMEKLNKSYGDGSIDIDKSVKPNSPLEKKIIRHEKQHIKDIDNGKLSYTDDYVTWNGKKYPRKDGMIKYDGKWCPEGSNKLPWEKKAKNAE